MHKQLQIYKDDFESQPIWVAEGRDLPVPSWWGGDVIELPGVPWWELSHQEGLAYRVLTVTHVLNASALGSSPDSPGHYLMKVAIAQFRPQDSEVNIKLQAMEEELASETQKTQFLEHIVSSTGRLAAGRTMEALIKSIVSAMKNEAAMGIEEAANAWEEASIIFQSSDHQMAQTAMHGQLQRKLERALGQLSQEERTSLWIGCGGLEDWMLEWHGRLEWNKHTSDLDRDNWRGSFDKVSQLGMERLTAELTEITLQATGVKAPI